MRVLLDSIYLFPLMGVRVRGVDPRLLLELRPHHGLLVSVVSLFELSAKGAEYVVQGVLEPVDVAQGVQSLSMDADIVKIPFISSRILGFSFRLRESLGDYLDCLILSTAVNEADVLLTEDDTLLGFAGEEANRALLYSLNSSFKIISSRQLLELGDAV